MIECNYCYQEIDVNTCHCGDLISDHGIGSGHSPVPMGCMCGYAKFKPVPKWFVEYIKALPDNKVKDLHEFLFDNVISLEMTLDGIRRSV